MELVPENFEGDQHGRIVLCEVMQGDVVKAHCTKRTIISSESEAEPYNIELEGNDVPEKLKMVLTPRMSGLAASSDLDEFTFEFIRIDPGKKYTIPFPVYILCDIHPEGELFFGPVQVRGIFDSLHLSNVDGLAAQPIREVPIKLSAALMQGNEEVVEEYRRRFRNGWSLFGNEDYYPDYVTKLGTVDNAEEKELQWEI